MGWLVASYNVTSREAREECRANCNWENDDVKCECLADGITGSGDELAYYAAIRQTKKATGESQVICGVTLLTLRPFGRKDMDETMRPRVDHAPREVLEALEPLPARDPQPCKTCEGTGKLTGPRWDERAQGAECHWCHGEGSTDKWDGARAWRKDAWARHGGEPSAKQMELV